MPDYENQIIVPNVSSWVCTQDVYINFFIVTSSYVNFYINSVDVAQHDQNGANWYFSSFFGFAKKGDRIDNQFLGSNQRVKVFPLRN